MKNVTPITPSQDKAALLIVSGLNLSSVASNVGINPRTLHRWMQTETVKNRIRELRTLAFEHAANRLQTLTGKAIDTLENNLSSGNRASEVRAAVSLLRLNLDLQEAFNFDSRLERIEQTLELK